MAEDTDFQGGGTRIDTLLRNQQGNPQQQYPPQYAQQQQYHPQQHPSQQYPQQPHPSQHYPPQYAQQYPPQQHPPQQYPQRNPPSALPNSSMRETFINRVTTLNWKESIIVFILTFLIMNHKVQSFIIPKLTVQYDWAVAGMIGSLIVTVLYLIITYFIC